MGLDIRLPIGAMFTVLGLLLAIYGLMTSGDAGLYQRSLFINVNLWWGIIILVFGVLLLVFARLGAKSEGVHPAADSPEGRATERREHELGLEKE